MIGLSVRFVNTADAMMDSPLVNVAFGKVRKKRTPGTLLFGLEVPEGEFVWAKSALPRNGNSRQKVIAKVFPICIFLWIKESNALNSR